MIKNRNQIAIFQSDLKSKQNKSFHTTANYSGLFSTFINLYYHPKNIKNFLNKKYKTIWYFSCFYAVY
jgi:hypothetical protein